MIKMGAYKEVLMPIKVPTGKFCHTRHKKCKYYEVFNYNGNMPICKMGFSITSVNSEGRILKPEECRLLKIVKG